MLRHNVTVRWDLDRIAADNGFDFHIIDNEIYWDESRAYRFTLRQIEEQIETDCGTASDVPGGGGSRG